MVVATFTNDLKDKELVRILYLNLHKDFDDIMVRVNDPMILVEALQSTDDEAP